MLFALQLFTSLPNYIPKGGPVLFQCTLGTEVVKNIELTNPTTKQIAYYVRKDGHSDFTIECDSVKIEPKSTIKFRVKFHAKLSKSVEAKLTFTNKREGNAQAAALVFDLKSEITEIKSLEFHTFKSKLYQSFDQYIQVKNIFDCESAEFVITLIPEVTKPTHSLS